MVFMQKQVKRDGELILTMQDSSSENYVNSMSIG